VSDIKSKDDKFILAEASLRGLDFPGESLVVDEEKYNDSINFVSLTK
jgi:hypothetical protein